MGQEARCSRRNQIVGLEDGGSRKKEPDSWTGS